MPVNRVTRCICHDRTFEEIKKFSEEHNIGDVKELQERNYSSNSCRMCTPYVEIVLEEGQTEFAPGEPHRRKRADQ